MPIEERDQRRAAAELRMAQAGGQQPPVGRQPQQPGAVQSRGQPVDGFPSRGRMRDQLAEHRVVVG
jgi:hypothetical protein